MTHPPPPRTSPQRLQFLAAAAFTLGLGGTWICVYGLDSDQTRTNNAIRNSNLNFDHDKVDSDNSSLLQLHAPQQHSYGPAYGPGRPYHLRELASAPSSLRSGNTDSSPGSKRKPGPSSRGSSITPSVSSDRTERTGFSVGTGYTAVPRHCGGRHDESSSIPAVPGGCMMEFRVQVKRLSGADFGLSFVLKREAKLDDLRQKLAWTENSSSGTGRRRRSVGDPGKKLNKKSKVKSKAEAKFVSNSYSIPQIDPMIMLAKFTKVTAREPLVESRRVIDQLTFSARPTGYEFGRNEEYYAGGPSSSSSPSSTITEIYINPMPVGPQLMEFWGSLQAAGWCFRC